MKNETLLFGNRHNDIGCQSFVTRETIDHLVLATKDELRTDQRTRSPKLPICFTDTLYLILTHDITRYRSGN